MIDAAIHTLSKDLPEAALVEGEQILLDQAKTHDPVGLAGIGEQLFAVLDPAGYQQAQEDKLERAERGAYAARGFTLIPDTIGSGSLIRGRGWVGAGAAARRYDALRELCRRSLHAEPAGSGDAARSNCGSPCRLRSFKADLPAPGRC
ncbi:MAG: hypothetical protein M3446_07325 [Actinomycetota bacterium]|nr:hypothetical protein [Actinomycetota bacterium]